jgi:exopolysaccharide production protein ExoY
MRSAIVSNPPAELVTGGASGFPVLGGPGRAARVAGQAWASPLGGGPKRILDIAIALAALALTLPLMAVIAVLIRLTGGGVIFAHDRIGYRGETFRCYKFRTMVPNADVALERYLAGNPEAALEWKERQKLLHDPRVTRLGRFLRKSSLDELPQLYNILRGDMSCVGPRPITFGELERYGDVVHDYLSSRPGLTGLWQVAGRSSTDFPTRVAFDKQYVRNWSFLMDIRILARTPAAVMQIAKVC